MNCDKCQDLITPLIHDLLKPEARQSVIEHIKGCPGCLAQFKQTKALHDRLTGNGHALARKDLEPAVWERITREKAAQLEAEPRGMGFQPMQHRHPADATRGHNLAPAPSGDARDTTEAARQATKSLRVRRNLMRSPLSKLAAAAAIVIAGIMGIVMWTGTGSGIVLADVLMQVQQATAYMYQMTGTITGKVPTGQDLNQNMQTTVLVSQDYGMKMTMSMPDPNGGTIQSSEIYMLLQEKAVILLMPATKQYRRMELDDSMLETTRRQNYDPGAMLQQVLNSKYESLGRSRIDGVDVEGFRTTDPNFLAGMMGAGVDVRIWVDVKTQYPVRLDMDMRMMDMEIRAVVHEFQWDYPVDAATFTPVIPADYTALPGMKMPAMDEHSAIAGLKLCAELTGRYPEKLDLMTASSMMSKLRSDQAYKLMAEEYEGLSKEEAAEKMKERIAEQVQRMMDKLMPIQSTVLFYLELAQEKKDPAYYGDRVTPEFPDAVLMRWKGDDGDYVIIFGNLTTGKATAEQLKELEADMAGADR